MRFRASFVAPLTSDEVQHNCEYVDAHCAVGACKYIRAGSNLPLLLCPGTLLDNDFIQANVAYGCRTLRHNNN